MATPELGGLDASLVQLTSDHQHNSFRLLDHTDSSLSPRTYTHTHTHFHSIHILSKLGFRIRKVTSLLDESLCL
ncbi:hypothetical protein CsSME_00041260 [Camellia sinensis var. sinensis]